MQFQLEIKKLHGLSDNDRKENGVTNLRRTYAP
jgi:hypothetical protein